jgi:predicted membrane protein
MDKLEHTRERRKSGGAGKGLIFLVIGAFLLVRNLDLDLPDWASSWQMLLIAIGIVIWSASGFKNWGGLIVSLVGAAFLCKEIFLFPVSISRFIWPAIFIVIGLSLIFSKNRPSRCRRKNLHPMPSNSSAEDELYASYIFSGENRIIVSKNFKGGAVTTIFGGGELNMSQADFQGRIELDVKCIFGGLELIVPANWHVQVELHSIMGGVSDKRPIGLVANNTDKVFVIKGLCVFGGIEIKNYV